jgi:hypothetical protein
MNMSNGTQMVGVHEEHHTGWVSFAGYLMVVAGFFHAIAGLVAIFKSDVYVASANSLLVFDYTAWGWTHLIFGAILIAGAFALFAGRMWGRILAITLATLSAILNFGFIQAYPLWSLLIIAMDVIIIYSVTTHGDEMAE